MTFRLGFQTGEIGLGRILQEGNRQLLAIAKIERDRGFSSLDWEGQSWSTWDLDWILDSRAMLMPNRIVDQLIPASRRAIVNVAKARYPELFLDKDGLGSVDPYLDAVGGVPRFRLAFGAPGDRKAFVTSIHQSQSLPGGPFGSTERPRYMILDGEGEPLRFGDLQDLIAGNVVDPDMVHDLVADPLFQEVVAGRFMTRLRQLYPVRPQVGSEYRGLHMLRPRDPNAPKQDLSWLDPIIAEQRRIQGPAAMRLISQVAALSERYGDDLLEQGIDLPLPESETEKKTAAPGMEM